MINYRKDLVEPLLHILVLVILFGFPYTFAGSQEDIDWKMLVNRGIAPLIGESDSRVDAKHTRHIGFVAGQSAFERFRAFHDSCQVRSRTDVRQGRQAGMSHRNSKPANHTAHFLAWMSSFTGLIMFSGSRIVSRSSCVRIPSSRTRSYTLRPVSIAFLAMLVEWS